MQIAVGGCLAQKDRGTHRRAGAVGRRRVRHPQPGRAARAARAGAAQPARPQVEIVEALQNFPSDLPSRRESAVLGLGVDLGRLRQHLHVLHRAEPARRRDRPAARRRAGRDRGAGRRRRRRGHPARAERQLLRPLVRRPARVRQAAARLRRRSTGSSGCASPARTRATSPTTSSPRWPRRRTSCPQLHMPMQSGSDAVLQGDAPLATAASATSASSTRVRAAMPDAAITTDIIVGFPGETEDDFEQTLDAVRAARFASAFTFQYSPAPRHAGRDHGRPGAQGRRAGALRAADRAAGGDLLGQEAGALVGRDGRGARHQRRGPQGRRDRPGVRRARDGRLVHVAPTGHRGRRRATS